MGMSSGYSDETGTGGYSGAGGDAIGAAIAAGAGLYDSYQNRKVAKRNTDATIAANKAEAELAYQRQVQMWNMQNMYNTPQAQMQRYLQAGLNPHLIYGQGNSGNASAPPAYAPPNMQYRYESGNFGAAVQQFLPTLMAVGTWMQNMRMSEVEIRQRQAQTESSMTSTEKARQLMDFLKSRHPQLLQEGENRLSLFSSQKSMAHSNAEKAWRVVADLEREYQHKWGEPLFDGTGTFSSSQFQGRGTGMRKLEFLSQANKNVSQEYQNKLLEAKSSMTDLNITDPQAIMQLVLSGIMGLAGQQIRLSTHRSSSRKNAKRENAASRSRYEQMRNVFPR